MTPTAPRIEIRHIDPSHTARVITIVPNKDVGKALAEIFREVYDYLTQSRIEARMPYGRFTPLGSEMHVEAGFTTAGPVTASGRITPGKLPGGEALVCLHTGPYDEVEEAYHVLGGWMVREGRVPATPPWEVYLSPPEEQPPRTEVVFVLEPL